MHILIKFEKLLALLMKLYIFGIKNTYKKRTYAPPTRVTANPASKKLQFAPFFTKQPGRYEPVQQARSTISKF